MKTTVIGAGAMGGALAHGLLKGGSVSAADLTVADPCTDHLEPFAKAGATVTTSNSQAAMGAQMLFVVVKPWLVQTVIKEIGSALSDNQTLVIVAAGVSGKQISQWVDEAHGGSPNTFLCIPNIAIAYLCSVNFIVPLVANSAATSQLVGVMSTMGQAFVTEEKLLPAATTLTSCGLAYALRYIRAASEGGVELGFKAAEATSMVAMTVKGAVALLEASGEHPESLIDRVTTPGGITIKGLNEMEHAGFTSTVIRGLKAAIKS